MRQRSTYDKILLALQKARGQLAIAFAMETKRTSAERWRDYRDMDKRMRFCLKELRARRLSGLEESQAWDRILEALKRLPVNPCNTNQPRYEAHQLCQQLGAVLETLKSGSTSTAETSR